MIGLYNKNIKWLKDNSDKCLINEKAYVYDFKYEIVESKEIDLPSLKISDMKNEEISIHSQLYPSKEAEKIVQSTDLQSDTIIIIGYGLGYVSLALRKIYPYNKLILIEPDINVFYLGLRYTDINLIGFDKIFIGFNDSEIGQSEIATTGLLPSSQRQSEIATTGHGFDIFIQKSQERLYGSLYQRIKNSLCRKSNFNLSDNWKYSKFTSEQTRILYIDSSYVLTKECLNAIINTGNIVHYIHIDLDNYVYENFIRNLMNDIIHFKPDFVLTINHLGFDNEGRLTSLFDEMELPFVSWFVDSPNVILSSIDKNISDFCNLFVWDDDYIAQLSEKGYKHCDILPLATDTSIFFPKELYNKYPISFVGSSMIYPIHKNMKSWVHRDDLLVAFREVVQAFINSNSRHVEPALDLISKTVVAISNRLVRDMPPYPAPAGIIFDSTDQKEDFIAAVLWRGTQIYRQSGIDKLRLFMPTVSGDPNWRSILPMEYNVLRERWYYDDLCDFYNQSMINFNMTSLQMTNAVNQRIFDVSACKRFLLTDHRSQLSEFFENKKNMVWFNDVNEIPDLVKYYLANENERDKISNYAYQTVLQYHTYNHRINKMIEIMKKRYK